MSARERRLKEAFNAALVGLEQAAKALSDAGCNQLRLDTQTIHNRVLKLRKTMIYPYETVTDPRTEKLEAALREIADRFENKLSLHKEDCFAYQVAKKALDEGV